MSYVTNVSTEPKGKIFADYITSLGISKWAQNNNSDIWHPLTEGQRANNLSNVKVGDTILFRYKSRNEGTQTSTVKVIDVGSPSIYSKLVEIYGHPNIQTWKFTDAIRVRII
jgi:uncharacterized repeat protein (TIGR01451 family)